MNTDSGVNVIVFEVLISRRLQPMLGECSTRVTDGLRKVWGELAAGFDLRPANVRRVYSQWEPTPEDRAFLASEFPPAVRVSYSFRRPPCRREWGRPTEEFVRAVDAFERALEEHERAANGGAKVGAQGRPWWQYWHWPGEGNNPFIGKPD
ncbi:hypothetical protein [Fimbriiglobus ruber]|uniref:Uncharacterized protein n=1 Tax=Fimbriiglobus ruber TaxID=1908690 RepID=A0A225DXT1_9BACT|nr:hypothetical protein [Fimbriiglobus ruber]OWK45763.1 hypothetical protein FRUB_02094 [Fimbriiglobus ruber]